MKSFAFAWALAAALCGAAAEPRPLAVPAKFITALTPDGAGGFWAGTEDDGAVHIAADLKTFRAFGVLNGPGDTNIYAVALDKLGRVWAGTLNHGVGVFNGQEWRSYGVENGPLGERVFAIACCPTDGDVWLATSAGLARYGAEKKRWSYFTAWDSLPTDQVQSLAFDAQGNLFAGLQCGGVAVARAAERYQKWITYAAPWYRDEAQRIPFPVVHSGKGLPCNFINQVLFAREGALLAATTEGLAWSRDGAKSWRHIRGQDFAAKVKGLWGGPPVGWQEPDATTTNKLLSEDFVTALAETADGKIWTGSREHGAALFDLAKEEVVQRWTPENKDQKNPVYVSALLTLPDGRVIAGTLGHGLWLLQDAAAPAAPAPVVAAKPPPLPEDAAAPGPATLAALEEQLGKLGDSLTNGSAVFVGEDWATQGDWVERYGVLAAFLCGPNKDAASVNARNFQMEEFVGPNAKAEEGPCVYIHAEKCDENRGALFFPALGFRQEAELNDSSFRYPLTQDGPDLWLKINPPGNLRGDFLVSLYFHNKDGHSGRNRLRDYGIEVRRDEQDGTRAELFNLGVTDPNAPADLLVSPVLARTRVRDFCGGVYKTFLLRGAGPYYVRIVRHQSHVTTLAGVMMDSFPRSAGSKALQRRMLVQFGGGRFFGRGGNPFGELDAEVNTALKLWGVAGRAGSKVGGAAAVRPVQCFAYRAAAASSNAPPELLDMLRAQIPIWDAQDRSNFWSSVKSSDQ